jgi:hypothetical protein
LALAAADVTLTALTLTHESVIWTEQIQTGTRIQRRSKRAQAL